MERIGPSSKLQCNQKIIVLGKKDTTYELLERLLQDEVEGVGLPHAEAFTGDSGDEVL